MVAICSFRSRLGQVQYNRTVLRVMAFIYNPVYQGLKKIDFQLLLGKSNSQVLLDLLI